MELGQYVSDLQRQLVDAAANGTEETRALAERIATGLDAATRLVLLEALSTAAAEITRDLAPGSVDLRLRGREVEFVVTQSADANAAMRANSAQMDKVMAAIRAAGIAERDVQTAGISLSPQYRYVENQPPAINGYQASNTVNVKVRDLEKLGKVLDALVANGANQINGPSFEIDQPDPVQDEARRNALKKAQERAAMYATALGKRVKRIVSINEGGGMGVPGPMPMMKMAAMDAGSPPVSPGETSLSVTLEVVFELGD